MNPLHVALLVCAPALAYFAVKLFLTENHKLAEKRKNAGKLAATLTAYGLSLIPDFLQCYASNDIEGMFADIEKTAQMFATSPAAVIEELDGVFHNVLNVKLQSTAGRAEIQAALTAATATPPKS